jgi:hypothetical protein
VGDSVGSASSSSQTLPGRAALLKAAIVECISSRGNCVVDRSLIFNVSFAYGFTGTDVDTESKLNDALTKLTVFEAFLDCHFAGLGAADNSSLQSSLVQTLSLIFDQILPSLTVRIDKMHHEFWYQSLKLLRLTIMLSPQGFILHWQQFFGDPGRTDAALSAECAKLCDSSTILVRGTPEAVTNGGRAFGVRSAVFSALLVNPGKSNVRTEALKCLHAAVAGLPLQGWLRGINPRKSTSSEATPGRAKNVFGARLRAGGGQSLVEKVWFWP